VENIEDMQKQWYTTWKS